MKSLTAIVGSLDIFGTLREQVVKPGAVQSAYQNLRLERPSARVRLRSASERLNMPSECVRRCAGLLEEIERTGVATIVVARRHDKKGRRMIPVTAKVQLDDNGEAEVPIDVAARLISHDKYGLLFEEIDTGAPSPGRRSAGAPPTPAEASRIAELEQRLATREAELDAQSARFEALLSRLEQEVEVITEPELEPEPEPTSTPSAPEPPRPPQSKKKRNR